MFLEAGGGDSSASGAAAQCTHRTSFQSALAVELPSASMAGGIDERSWVVLGEDALNRCCSFDAQGRKKDSILKNTN
jgi:hypothetical protein